MITADIKFHPTNGGNTMRKQFSKFAQAAGVMLAMVFTFSCSSGDDNSGGGGGSSSSGGGGGLSSPSGSGPKGAILTEIWTLNSYDSDGKIDGTYTYRKGYEYDNNGNIIKEISYDDNYWIVDYYETYEYDSNGNKIKGTQHSESGISGSTEYEYDSNGNKTKETRYYNGNIASIYEWEYDSNGNAIKEAQYDGSGNIKFRYEYDSDGIITKYTSYENDGSIRKTYTQTNEVTYTTINSKKLIATCISERPDGTKTKDEYQYDAKGNETKNTHYLWNKTTGSYEKTSESTNVYTYIN